MYDIIIWKYCDSKMKRHWHQHFHKLENEESTIIHIQRRKSEALIITEGSRV